MHSKTLSNFSFFTLFLVLPRLKKKVYIELDILIKFVLFSTINIDIKLHKTPLRIIKIQQLHQDAVDGFAVEATLQMSANVLAKIRCYSLICVESADFFIN